MPRIPLLITALFFMSGSLAYFLFFDFFVLAMPAYLPFHHQLIYISGVLGMLGAIGILVPKTRLFAACTLIALSIVMFPANMNMAINSHLYNGISPVFIYLSLPFQLIIIGFIWWSIALERQEKGWFSNESPLMKNLTSAVLEKVYFEFAETFQGILFWKWDDRFDVLMAEFNACDETSILTNLEYYFTYYWDASTIYAAPVVIQKVVARFGGLKAGQLLLSSNPEKDLFLYCVLWPWSCGKIISLRISIFSADSNKEMAVKQNNQLKIKFGVNDKSVDSGWVKVD